MLQKIMNEIPDNAVNLWTDQPEFFAENNMLFSPIRFA